MSYGTLAIGVVSVSVSVSKNPCGKFTVKTWMQWKLKEKRREEIQRKSRQIRSLKVLTWEYSRSNERPKGKPEHRVLAGKLKTMVFRMHGGGLRAKETK
ncbi:hypothetical protein BO86DRAFT_247463 [Aspergillus japonicus CBS 114.51]|uniref:Uncharacterized protein n=1 Tax=Aspergillus japonicus CBS 114.51 TaxID=1448312 RepID=A0A8T8WLS2_ASPJA|nr:hypothetical protein BO86DRAFT_247463 [Aspergillus japonicus CBS 114.51]RAH76644.1 hypothetical protein BO86DRAFT_247463 [Aspergillus japonicus CBS 114.51]